jgi:hypothetical protein
LLFRVTLEDAINVLFCEFEGSIFQILTSHTCYRESWYSITHKRDSTITLFLFLTKVRWIDFTSKMRV